MKLYLFVVFVAATLAGARAEPLPPTPGQQGAHVLNRIAFGPAPGDLERVTRSGVHAYIDSQLAPEAIALPAALGERLAGLETPNRSAGKTLAEFEEARRNAHNNARDETPAAQELRRARVARIARETAEARLLRAIASPRQLEEVMVDFWFNHFNVAASKGNVQALVASYERDAIRPYVFGSFRQLLGATAKHPAMLYYLDNYLSAAPAPAKAKGRARGLNENYARELMELHTLGVDGGYSQRDVTELARMLTGWTYDQRALIGEDQAFRFDPKRHDQGAKTWLGRAVPADGQQEGEMALDVLAVHPATARHLSYKLAQYFVRDDPPPALVGRLANTWQANGGDIRGVLRVLFASDEFMAPANMGAKFKTPYQYVVSAARASATPPGDIGPLLGTLTQLGMPLYGCQTPDGYKNTEAAWMNPHALTRRIVFATALGAGRLGLGKGAPVVALQDASSVTPAPLDPLQLASTLGDSVSPRTQELVAASPVGLRAAMLLGGPDFMQR